MDKKEKIIGILTQVIEEIKNKEEKLDISCLIVQQQKGEYIVDIHEYK